MKTFTIKDFVACNSPCFACNKPIIFHIIGSNSADTFTIKPTIHKEYISINLATKYNSSLQLNIDLKTNKFMTNNLPKLIKYLKSHNLVLRCYCSNCYTQMFSKPLDFNFEKCFIKPVNIQEETIIISNKKRTYCIVSVYDNNKSTILITDDDHDYENINTQMVFNGINIGGKTPDILEMPLLTRFKFKDKKQLLEKLNLYTLFS
jgi:hypothetical protein